MSSSSSSSNSEYDSSDSETAVPPINATVMGFTSVGDIVASLTPKQCCELVFLISTMHRSFDRIIQSRGTAATFRGRSNQGFLRGMTLYRILSSATYSVQNIRRLCFGRPPYNAGSSGLLLWYCEPGNAPKLCQVVNPYDEAGRRAQAIAMRGWDAWRNLEPGPMRHYLGYQKAQYARFPEANMPYSLWANLIHGKTGIPYDDITDDLIDALGKKTNRTFKKKFSTETQNIGGVDFTGIDLFNKIRELVPEIIETTAKNDFPLTADLRNYLQAPSGAPLLDPDANQWMIRSADGAIYSNSSYLSHPIIIQVLTTNQKANNMAFSFSAVGKEIRLDTAQKLNSCILFPSLQGLDLLINQNAEFYGSRVNFDIFARNIADQGQIDTVGMGNWKPIFQTFLRDAYGKLGNPSYQNKVPFVIGDSNGDEDEDGVNPTPGKSIPPGNKSNGLICAVCGCRTPNGKKTNWARILSAGKQTWDVDHIANLIFNELFQLNETGAVKRGDGRGFLNTCGTCNRQFKGEKLWSPSFDLWDALIARCGNDSISHAVFPWPGLDSPGIINGRDAPAEGWRVYMTKAYQSQQSPGRARLIYGSQHALQTNQKTIAKGIKKGKAVQQAEGMSFANKQDGKKPTGKPLISPVQLEAIILNRFALICRDSRLGKAIVTLRSIESAINLVTGVYNRQISVFPAVSQFISNISRRQEISDQLGEVSSGSKSGSSAGPYLKQSESQQAYDYGAEAAGEFGDSDYEPGSELGGFSQDSNSGSLESSPSKSPAKSVRQLEAGVNQRYYDKLTQRGITSLMQSHRSPGFSTARVIPSKVGKPGPRIITEYHDFLRRRSSGMDSSLAEIFARQIVDKGLTRADVNDQQDRIVENINLERKKYKQATRELKKLDTAEAGTTSPNRRKNLENLQSTAIKRIKGYYAVNIIIDDFIRPELNSREPGRRLSKSFRQQNTAAQSTGMSSSTQSTGMSSSSSAAAISPRKPKGKRKAGEALSGEELSGVGRRLLRNAMDLPPAKCELPNISNISQGAINFHNLGSQLGMLIFALRRDYAEGIFDNQENMGVPAELVGDTDSGRALRDNTHIGPYIKRVEAHKTPRKVWHHLNSIRNADGTPKVVNPYLTETYNSKTTAKRDEQGTKYMPGVIHHWSNFIILSALNHYCPRGEWRLTPRGGISSSDDTIQIRYEVGQGGDTAHWVVWEQGSGNIREIDVYDGRERVETSNYHRIGGDCGPSAVIKAIQLIQARNRPVVRRKKGATAFSMGGKRTRKKRRKKKKTIRKRKYNKKTKGRKRRRKKRTRRK